MSAGFEQLVVDIGRLRLSCFFVSFIAAFLFIRFSVRMLRAQGEVVARERHTWWGAHSPRGLRPGLHVWAESAALAVQDNRLG
jgi:hypothetical protein